MKIRARITALVEARLELAAPHREALRRALAILAMPQNAARGARLGWRASTSLEDGIKLAYQAYLSETRQAGK
ncbi:hypothetical protein, partial [Raoultella ornithinolytica]|uniref:hypothetical protein n=1 Tax=Raoultella ornithinolytica TaxID=54291 RepID=UPI001953830B